MRTHQAAGRDVDRQPDRNDTALAPGKRTLTEQQPAQDGSEPEGLVAQASAGPSQQLPGPLRGRLERTLGTSLGEVRIFTSSAADTAAKAYGAQAFALGLDVFFASGRYQPETPEGQELIAHEVAHTVQQRGATREGPLEVSSPGDAHEVEAEQFAQSFGSGEDAARPVSPVGTGTVSRAVIARQVEVLRGGARSSRGIEGSPPASPAGPSVEQRLTAAERRADESDRRQAETERRVQANFRLDQIRTQVDAGYLNLSSRLNAGFAPYREAHRKYVAALQAHQQQQAMMGQLLLSILCIGLGGMAGGALQQVIQGASASLLRIAVATAGGDLAKFILQPPNGAPAGPPEGDIDPQVWLTGMISSVQASHSSLLAAIGQLTGEVASGRVPPEGVGDPIASVTAELARLTSIAQVRPESYYATELWRAWLDRNEATFRNRADLVRFLMQHRSLLRAINEQCGEQGTAMVRQKMCASATTGRASIDHTTGRQIDTPLYGCGPTE